jgi:hypothetical protein
MTAELVHVEAPASKDVGASARQVGVRLAGLSGRSLWAAGCWSAHHRCWSLLVVLVTGGVDVAGFGVLFTVEVGAGGLAPALIAGFWIVRWPIGYEVHVSGPWRRFRWRRRVRRSWPEFSESVGLGTVREVKRKDKETGKTRIEKRWRPAKIKLSASDVAVTVSIPVPMGRTIADVLGVADALGSAVRAYAVRSRKVDLSLGEIELVMIDALSVPRGSQQPAASGPVIFGRREDGRDLTWDPAGDVHVAIQGQTRSGKSIATYTLLSGLTARSNVLVVGCDPSGVLLRPWADGPGGHWIALGTTDLGQAARVLGELVVEMERRISSLWPQQIDKIEKFTADLPVLAVVLEEWPGLISSAQLDDAASGRKPAERLAPKIQGAAGRLIKEGAKVGVRVLVLAQRMSSEAINGDDRSNFSLRLTLRVDNGDAIRMLHPGGGADPAEVRGFDPGVALYESPASALQRSRIDYTDYSQYCRRVKRWVRTAPAAAPVRVMREADPVSPLPDPVLTVVDDPVQLVKTSASAAAPALSEEEPDETPVLPRRPRQPRQPRQPRASRDSAA